MFTCVDDKSTIGNCPGCPKVISVYMYLISVLSASRLKELIKRVCVSEVIRYSLPYLSIPSIEKLGFKIVDIIDLSRLTFVTIPTTYEFLSMTRSFSLRLRFSPPEIISVSYTHLTLPTKA